jgi:hypothetical protein
MRQVTTALIATTCFFLFATAHASAQGQKTVTVTFRNQLPFDLVVQGYQNINGVIRPGQTIVVKKNGGVQYESNVPVGTRYYNISPYVRPMSPLLRMEQVTIQNRDMSLTVTVSPTDPKRVVLVPE